MVTVTLPNDLAAALAQQLDLLYVADAEVLTAGAKLTAQDEEEITKSMAAMDHLQDQFRAHFIECKRLDDEDAEKKAKKFHLPKRVAQTTGRK